MKLFYAEATDEDTNTSYLIKNCRTLQGADKKITKYLTESYGKEWVRKAYIYVREIYLTNDVTYL